LSAGHLVAVETLLGGDELVQSLGVREHRRSRRTLLAELASRETGRHHQQHQCGPADEPCAHADIMLSTAGVDKRGVGLRR
jgi:hypothetical protein